MLRFADTITSTPAHVSDEMYGDLARIFTTPQLVELSSAIAWENYRARTNRLFNVEADGFSAAAFCPLPVPEEQQRRPTDADMRRAVQEDGVDDPH